VINACEINPTGFIIKTRHVGIKINAVAKYQIAFWREHVRTMSEVRACSDHLSGSLGLGMARAAQKTPAQN
jgi:uncharacterized membrane-anchored protein